MPTCTGWRPWARCLTPLFTLTPNRPAWPLHPNAMLPNKLSKRPEPWLDYDLTDREGEEWRDVTAYDGLYQVSSYGRVKSLARFDRKGRRIQERILRPFFQGSVAAQLVLVEDGCKKMYQVLRLVGEAFLPPLLPSQTWHHRNKLRPLDNSVTNILCGTPSERTRLTFRTGLIPYTGFTDGRHVQQKKEARDQEVGTFENGVLVAQWCRTCLEQKPMEAFSFLDTAHQHRSRQCRTCENRRRQERKNSKRIA